MLDERFGEKQLCWQSAQIFHQFRNSSKRFSEFWREFSGRVVTTAFCVPSWSFFFKFWRREMKENKLLFENFAFLSFSDFERKRSLVLLQAWLRQSCQNLFVHVQTNISRKKRFFGKFDFFHHFRSSSIKYSEFWQKIFGRVVTTAFYMYIGTFLGKLFSFRKVQSFFSLFSESELQMCGLSEKNICYRCQDCILRC